MCDSSGAELGALAVARADVLELAVDQREVQLGDLVALDEHRARLARVTGLQRRELRGLDGHGLLLFGDMDGRARVLAGDRAQVVEPLDQVGEAVGLEDDGRDVRRGRLVGGDQLGDQHLPVAPELDLQRGQVGAGAAQLGAQAGEQVALGVEARFQRVQARLQVVDAALEALDLVGVGADPRVQLAFAGLRGGDPAFECALLEPAATVRVLAAPATVVARMAASASRRAERGRRGDASGGESGA